MYAITLWQPWAWAMGIGLKRVENRPWEPPASLIGERFALHAGNKWDRASSRLLAKLVKDGDPPPPEQGDVVHGAIVAITRLVAVVTTEEAARRIGGRDQARWFFGPYGWIVEDTVTLPEPVKCRGYQKLWNIPAETEKAVFRQYR